MFWSDYCFLIIVKILQAIMIGSFGFFLQECFKSPMIFRRYYLYLMLIWQKNWRKKDRWKRKIAQLGGLCIYCQSSWIAIFYYLYKYGFNIDIFLFIGTVFLFQKLLIKKLDFLH